ncbi:universal stress protein [Modestobacter sp. I12A-02662]|uniref:universal stress protein n=1 Tax=Modestobacter sp. I12A-02662 TaxID=1730496 RepID=UPI0034E00967
MSGGQAGPVVVAVGHGGTGEALDWAAAEASARGCGLRVVHAEPLRWAVDPSGLAPAADIWSSRAAAEQIMAAALRRARAVAPDVAVSAESVVGPPVPLLVSAGRGAQLLVLGSRDTPFTWRLPALSTCDRVAGRAPCPVAVVRPLRSGPHAGSSPGVVVGVGGRGACAGVLAVAFRAAAQRGVPVRVVHAWSPDVPADHEAVCGPAAAAEERARLVVDEALAGWRSRFADVVVETRLPVDDPAAALVRESAGASLTVVGSRPRTRVGTALVGSVSRSVARRARCPVVVVRTATAERPGVAVDDRRRRAPWQ